MLHSKSIGNKIAAARKKVNLSQAELAQQVSISSQAVGKWERGESMPDITTLNRLAEIFGVDLNYFSESFKSSDSEVAFIEKTTISPTEKQAKKLNWDISKLNLVDSDFSGLKDLQEKFSSSNMKNCQFIGSDLSELLLKNNYIDRCDFSNSDISNSNIQSTYLTKGIFKHCSLKETEFSKSYIEACDFSDADFSSAEFKFGGFGKNTIANAVFDSTFFIEMRIQDIVFEGTLEGCSFENCTFYGVKFQNATIINTFFKNNMKFKRVKFINCKADKLTYAFLKNNRADMTGITLLS